MMNRNLLIILIVIFPLHLSAQLIPLSDQYLNNTLAINPSFAGSNDALSATISYRNQWVGFRDAPENLIFSVHTPVYNDRVGLGFLVEKTSVGVFNTTGLFGNYAYRMEFNEGKLALGLGFGVTVYNVAWNRLEATDPDDELLMNSQSVAVLPDFSLGAYYYTPDYFIGFSIPMFLSHELNKNSGSYRIVNRFSEYNYLLSGGYYLTVNKQLKVLPSVLIKYRPGNIPQIDIDAQAILHDRLSLGAGYRSDKVLVGLLQCQLNHQLKMAYSYDFDLGKLEKYTGGSHEILLNYVFSYIRKVAGPRNF